MDKHFEQLKKEVEEERRRLYLEQYGALAKLEENSLLDEKACK